MDAQYCPPVLGGRAVGGGGQNSQFSTLNFCDKREQSSLLRLPSEAKITTEGSNSQFSIPNWYTRQRSFANNITRTRSRHISL